MEKEMLEMMGQMTEIKTEITGMKSEMNEMKIEMTGMKSEMAERFDSVNVRFDTVEQRLSKLDGSVIGVGQHFEELSKNTIQVQDEMKRELKYITHKIHALDREVFMRTDSPQ